jgi:hypothetical protein
MADDFLTIDLGENGGFHSFKSFDQLRQWLQKERERWQWMQGQSPWNPWDPAQAAFAQLLNETSSAESNYVPIAKLAPTSERWFAWAHGAALLHSTGLLGARVLEIREVDGPEAAATAYAYAKNRIGIGNVNSMQQLTGILKLALSGQDRAEAVAQRHKQERASDRSHWRRLLSEQESDAAQRENARRLQHLRTRKRLARALRRRAIAYEADRTLRKEEAAQAVSDIKAVEQAYKVAMGLQAPVEYWKGKAKQHKDAEGPARDRVVWFFPLAFVLLSALFGGAAALVLNRPSGSVPTPLLFVLSGGLATVAGLTFWAGRLLTKLYLSEHHLRHDAEERAVMTTTYLALIKDNAADAGDRSIVLNALFRSTPDGIVKEDAPPDLNVASLLAKTVAPR